MSENYAIFRRRGSENDEPVGVITGFESEAFARFYAGRTSGQYVRDPRLGGYLVLKVEALDSDELADQLRQFEQFEAERQAEAERIAKQNAEENARKMREQRLAELVEEQERKAFLAERERWRKAAEKELAKEESEDSIPESTRATVDTLRGSTGN